VSTHARVSGMAGWRQRRSGRGCSSEAVRSAPQEVLLLRTEGRSEHASGTATEQNTMLVDGEKFGTGSEAR